MNSHIIHIVCMDDIVSQMREVLINYFSTIDAKPIHDHVISIGI